MLAGAESPLFVSMATMGLIKVLGNGAGWLEFVAPSKTRTVYCRLTKSPAARCSPSNRKCCPSASWTTVKVAALASVLGDDFVGGLLVSRLLDPYEQLWGMVSSMKTSSAS